jgi:hypothetical protein
LTPVPVVVPVAVVPVAVVAPLSADTADIVMADAITRIDMIYLFII